MTLTTPPFDPNMGIFLCNALTYAAITSLQAALTRRANRFIRWLEHKSRKRLLPCPLVYNTCVVVTVIVVFIYTLLLYLNNYWSPYSMFKTATAVWGSGGSREGAAAPHWPDQFLHKRKKYVVECTKIHLFQVKIQFFFLGGAQSPPQTTPLDRPPPL